MSGFSRRKLLAATGTVGFLLTGARLGRAALGLEAVEFEERTAVEADDEGLIFVDWRETYNGVVVDDGSTERPSISLDDVLPGDAGTLTVRLRLDETASPAYVELLPELTAVPENGRTEPEAKAGDDSPDSGELQDYLDLEIWYDVGALGVGSIGGCNGREESGEPMLVETDSLTEVVEEHSGGVRIDASPETDGVDCFGTDTVVCLALTWELDADVGNLVQSDGVDFDLVFYTLPCDPDTFESGDTE